MTSHNEDICIKLVTDKQELSDKGHDLPIIELYNDYIETWIPIWDLSYARIRDEITHIKRVTGYGKSRNDMGAE